MSHQIQDLITIDLSAKKLELNLDSPGELSEAITLALATLHAQPQQLSHWQLAHYAAVESWLLDYHPSAAAAGLEQVRGYLEAFHHCCEVEAWDMAWQILQIPIAPQQQPLHEQLSIWGHHQTLINCYSRLLNKLPTEVNCIFLCGLAASHRIIGDTSQAIDYGTELLEKGNSLKDQCLILRGLGYLGDAYRVQGNCRLSNDFYQKKLILSHRTSNIHEQIQSRCGMARLEVINLQYYKAETLLRQSLRLSDASQGHPLKYKIIHELANLYSLWGKYETALSYLKKEEKTCRDSGNTDDLGEVLQNLGHYYITVNQYDKALAYFQESLELARNSDNKINLHAILNSMGVLYCFHLDKPESALSYLEQALSYANSIGDLRVIAHGKAALSGCLGKQKRYQEALDHATEAQQISQKFGYRQVEAIATGAIANAHWHNGHRLLGLWNAVKMCIIWKPWKDANGHFMLRIFFETVGRKLDFLFQKKAKGN